MQTKENSNVKSALQLIAAVLGKLSFSSATLFN